MTKKTVIDILKVAKLANLPVNQEEERTFQKQLTKILDYIDKIEKADTKTVDPTYNVSSNTNIIRGDKPNISLTQKESLQNAKEARNGFFVTKGVFENE